MREFYFNIIYFNNTVLRVIYILLIFLDTVIRGNAFEMFFQASLIKTIEVYQV